jgi:excisionase family DNA binding protein
MDEREQLVADGLATVAEGERFLSLGRSKLYDLMDAGELPYCKIGKSRRIPWEALRRLAVETLRIASNGGSRDDA